jgi:uncharacterized protein YdiU (UPF0061 family)
MNKMVKIAKKARIPHSQDYQALDQLDGSHPWQEQVPEGLITYPVRKLNQGRVAYFNFQLAKEMGIIPLDHPNQMNKKLEEKLLETFSLRIINEYDQQNKIQYPKRTLKKNRYMATRYLQLQHSDKSGRTSGDGRCIWNGIWSNGKSMWDVSSRGTGVTALAPGAVQAGKPLKSGNVDFGYGCGLAEIDELFGASLMAEILHRNGLATERVLATIDLGKGVGIGVRAAPNLIRPAHLFLFLKQGRIEPLRRAVDYFLDRQNKNGEWNIALNQKDKYKVLLDTLAEGFAKFIAYLDREFIFTWLAWDGDNVLANAGIIDYGSVRQFGLRHDQYRYDDIERFSTNLNEQKQKARLLVQVFIQMTHFLETGTRKPLPEFGNHPVLKAFDERFEHHMHDRFLYQLGFEPTIRRLLLNRHPDAVTELFSIHSEFERVKTHKKISKVADGIHRPAIFNMRAILASMPEHLLKEGLRPYSNQDFFKTVVSTQAKRRDRKLSAVHENRIKIWQKRYIRLLQKVSTPQNINKLLLNLKSRAELINREDRLTGNALINVVDEILKFHKKGADLSQIQAVLDKFIEHQTLSPDFRELEMGLSKRAPENLLRTLLTLTYGYREDI